MTEQTLTQIFVFSATYEDGQHAEIVVNATDAMTAVRMLWEIGANEAADQAVQYLLQVIREQDKESE